MKKLSLKEIISAVLILSSMVGGLYFMEDRFNEKASAAEQKAVETFQEQQALYKEEQKTVEYKRERARLEDLRTDQAMLKKLLKDDPENELLQDKLEKVNGIIEKIETKIYGGDK